MVLLGPWEYPTTNLIRLDTTKTTGHTSAGIGGADPKVSRPLDGETDNRWKERQIDSPGIINLVLLSGVTLLAAVVQSTLGFGFTLLAVSFFLLILQSATAIQLLIVLNLVISLWVGRTLWRNVPRDLWIKLVAGAMVGFPAGLVLFYYASVDQLKVGVAVAILVFVPLLAFRRRSVPEQGASLPIYRLSSSVGVGVLAGAMTTSLGMPGPVLVLYLTAHGADKDALRAISLTFFAVAYAVALLLQALTFGVDGEVWTMAVVLVPVAAVGAQLGHQLSRRVTESTFRRAVLVLIGATGVYTLLTTLIA